MSNGIGTSLERKKEKVTIFETPAGRERERERAGEKKKLERSGRVCGGGAELFDIKGPAG